MKTSERLKALLEDKWKQYVRHNFVEMLRQGTLDKDSFRFYIIQDSKYVEMMIDSVIRASSLAGFKDSEKILRSVIFGRDSGMEVHKKIHSELNITEEEIKRTGYTLVNYAYTRHLYYYSTKSWKLFLSAWLPCMWGYSEIGEYTMNSPDHLYSSWATFYASEDYKSRVEVILEAIDSIPFSEDMVQPFSNSISFEIMFWDSALRKDRTDIMG
ncbi:TenA family transcriptional regulator [Candidatus Acidianus copahuensis]|uniref:TenA family transcriptional regulator n=1 Tax=Candidatus Acidianus copahuensis TaxID=1160895 RepID=A0A031LNA9_9CREN|nr:TenA family protein [Candidatus Acidianus copahuensis]EZQ06572.1 TenA family transcriptional regulator [Candidatus Acidianus copahuensis]